MISIADLNDLRAAARRRNGGFADPRETPAMEALMRDRGTDWCSSVLGYPVMGGLRSRVRRMTHLNSDAIAATTGGGVAWGTPGQWMILLGLGFLGFCLVVLAGKGLAERVRRAVNEASAAEDAEATQEVNDGPAQS